MDMKCMKCGEPWDLDYLHKVLGDLWNLIAAKGGYIRDDISAQDSEKVGSKDDANWRFSPGPYIEECPNCINNPDIEPDARALCRAALATVLGDDIDGFIAECEDWDL